MDEYIKVKDLVDMLEQRLVFQETHGFYRDAGYTSRFIESIADIPHINVAPKPEWISVEDRLPEEEGAYLVLIVDYLGEERMEVVELFKWANCFDWSSHMSSRWKDSNTITHWMPLPSPPTENND